MSDYKDVYNEKSKRTDVTKRSVGAGLDLGLKTALAWTPVWMALYKFNPAFKRNLGTSGTSHNFVHPIFEISLHTTIKDAPLSSFPLRCSRRPSGPR